MCVFRFIYYSTQGGWTATNPRMMPAAGARRVLRGRHDPAIGSQLWWYHASTSEFVKEVAPEPLVPQKLDALEQPEQCE